MPSGGGTSTQTTNNQVTMTPEQRMILNQMTPGLMNHLQNPPEVYSGPRVADFTEPQRLSQQMLLTAAGPGGALQQAGADTSHALWSLGQGGPAATYSPEVTSSLNNLLGGQAGQQAANQVQPNQSAATLQGAAGPAQAATIGNTGIDPFQKAAMYNPEANANLRLAAQMGPGQLRGADQTVKNSIDRLLSPALLDVNSNPYMKQAITAATQPVMDNLMTKILPAVRSGAVATGTYGSNRQGLAEATAIKDANQTMANTAATMASGMYNSGLQQQAETARGESGQLTQRLATLMQDEASRQRTSADLAGSLTGSTLGAESSRYSTDTQRAIADMQTQAQQAIAQMQAKTQLEQARMNAMTQLLQTGLQQQGGATSAALQNQAQNRGISVDAQSGALQGAPNAVSTALAPGVTTGAVGTQQQQQNQAGIDANILRHTQDQYRNFNAMQDVASIIFGQIPTGTSSSATSTQPSSWGNTINSASQLGMTAAMLMMASDRKCKFAIKQIGKLSNGLKLYEYRYIFAPKTRFVGIMADEVEAHNPNAVATVGGIKHVNYAEALKDTFALKEAA